MNITLICNKCDDGEPCKLIVPNGCDYPLWCPFGLYPDKDSIDEFEANWKLLRDKQVRRKMK